MCLHFSELAGRNHRRIQYEEDSEWAVACSDGGLPVSTAAQYKNSSINTEGCSAQTVFTVRDYVTSSKNNAGMIFLSFFLFSFPFFFFFFPFFLFPHFPAKQTHKTTTRTTVPARHCKCSIWPMEEGPLNKITWVQVTPILVFSVSRFLTCASRRHTRIHGLCRFAVGKGYWKEISPRELGSPTRRDTSLQLSS